MENLYSNYQALCAWAIVVIPFILFGIAAIRWGVYTTGDRGPKNTLDF